MAGQIDLLFALIFSAGPVLHNARAVPRLDESFSCVPRDRGSTLAISSQRGLFPDQVRILATAARWRGRYRTVANSHDFPDRPAGSQPTGPVLGRTGVSGLRAPERQKK
jgi:hypothetical protein